MVTIPSMPTRSLDREKRFSSSKFACCCQNLFITKSFGLFSSPKVFWKWEKKVPPFLGRICSSKATLICKSEFEQRSRNWNFCRSSSSRWDKKGSKKQYTKLTLCKILGAKRKFTPPAKWCSVLLYKRFSICFKSSALVWFSPLPGPTTWSLFTFNLWASYYKKTERHPSSMASLRVYIQAIFVFWLFWLVMMVWKLRRESGLNKRWIPKVSSPVKHSNNSRLLWHIFCKITQN